MKNFLIAFLVFLVWSFFGLWLYSWLEPKADDTLTKIELADNSAEEEATDSIIDIPIPTDDAVSDAQIPQDSILLSENEDEILDEVEIPEGLIATNQEGDIVFLMEEGISVTQNSANVNIPEAIVDFKYKLNTYLIEHPDMELHILSRYSALENIETPNLGIQRGEKIKDLLVNTGIENSLIVTKPTIKNIDFNAEGRFANGISFTFKPLDTNRVNAIKNAIPDVITTYPKYSNRGILVNPSLQELKDQVAEVIAENPNLTVEVIGHTDNVGNANDNYMVGLKHARQVRWFLVTKGGIDRKKIIATSRGESESIASNKTERGRTLNRRIEVKFK